MDVGLPSDIGNDKHMGKSHRPGCDPLKPVFRIETVLNGRERPVMPLIAILIEDSETIRDNLIPAMAELADIRVIAIAETAAEALASIDEHGEAWDLAVVDLFLKAGSGLTVLRACQRRAAHQQVVVLTNYPTPEMRRHCLALGADAVFDKSTELEAFFEHCSSHGPKRASAPETKR